MLEPREQALLSALSENTWRTADLLAEELNVSPRTVRSTVKRLRMKLEGNGAKIASRTHYGYLLQVTDRDAYDAFCGDRSFDDAIIPSDVEERVRYLAFFLAVRSEWIKLDDLAAKLCVSRYTVTSDLRRVQQEFDLFGLSIMRRPSYGIKVDGAETDIRACAVQILNEYDGIFAHLSEDERNLFRQVAHLLQEMGQEFDLHFPEISFRNLVNSTFVGTLRLLLGCYLSGPLVDERDHESSSRRRSLVADIPPRLWNAASWLVQRLEALIHVAYTQQEEEMVAIEIAGKHNYGRMDDESENVVIPSKLMGLVDSMLEAIFDSFKLDYRNNLPLRMNLGQHLVALDIRMRYEMPVDNPLVGEIQKQYPLAYALAGQAAIPLIEYYGHPLSDNEIGYLSYIFELALEQEDASVKKNILVVCVSGIAGSQLVAYQLEQEFATYINKVYVCDVYRLETFDFSRVDYVFTSVPIHMKVEVPVVRIGEIMSESSRHRVRSVLEGYDAEGLARYYRRDLFFPHIEGNTKDEAIRNICKAAADVVSLPDEFCDAVLAREEQARTDFCPLVAFPHAYQVLSSETFVAVGILREPIHWVKNDVQVMLLVSIADTDNPDLQRFYRATMSFIQDTDRVEQLIRYRDYDVLMMLLSGKQNAAR